MLGADEAGWIGEIHPQVASDWGWSQPIAAFELDLDAVAERVQVARYRDLTSFPDVREDLAVIVAESVSAADVVAVVREAGAPLLADAEVFDVYRGEQAGRRQRVARAAARVPRSRSDADRRGGRRQARARSRPPSPSGCKEGSVTHSVAVFGAAGYAGALGARLLDRHPAFDLETVTSRSDVGRRLDELYPHHRVSLVLEELDLDRHAEVDAALVAYPHGAAAELVAELVRRGVRVVDLSADFRLRDADVYEQWYRPHPEPELLSRAVYGLPERYREQIAGAEIVANPGCYPTATVLALAPLARAGLIADVVIDAKSGVSGAGRAATDETHFVTVDENVNAVRRPAPPPHARDRAGAGGARRRAAGHIHGPPAAAGPGGACLLLRDS